MSGKFAVFGVLFLVSSAVGGLLDRLDNSQNEKKEPEKKPNIVKDYVCLRDGDLCHPSSPMNRGIFVACSNGVAWEQTCPRCSYHPLTCPTRTLWFDGEKCDWASPKLASQPCIDRVPLYDTQNGTFMKESASSEYGMADALIQAHHSIGGPLSQNAPMPGNSLGMGINVNKDQIQNQIQGDKGKWPGLANSMSAQQPPIYYKSPKSEEEEKQASAKSAAPSNSKLSRRKSAPEPVEQEGIILDEDSLNPAAYLDPEDVSGAKIVKLNDPIYALVDSPDGDGKQVLVKVSQPFVFEDTARTLLPTLNALSPYAIKN